MIPGDGVRTLSVRVEVQVPLTGLYERKLQQAAVDALAAFENVTVIDSGVVTRRNR